MICALFALAVARPSDESHAQEIVRVDDVRPDGFSTKSETDNSIQDSREGDVHGNIHGHFAWTSPEGKTIDITYVADENGYQPSGDSLPVAPPTPEAILKSLEYIQGHPQAQEHH